MHRTAATIAMLASIALVSCGDGNGGSGPGSATGDWLPLEVGGQWDYTAQGWLKVPSEEDTFDITGDVDQVVVSLVQHSDGFDVYRIETYTELVVHLPDSNFVDTDTSRIYACNTETEFRAYDDTLTSTYETVLRYPLSEGDSWQPYPDSTSVTRKVLSITASVSVPAGSYSGCARLRDTDSEEDSIYAESYMAPGTGMVKQVMKGFDPADSVSTYVEIDLTGYSG